MTMVVRCGHSPNDSGCNRDTNERNKRSNGRHFFAGATQTDKTDQQRNWRKETGGQEAGERHPHPIESPPIEFLSGALGNLKTDVDARRLRLGRCTLIERYVECHFSVSPLRSLTVFEPVLFDSWSVFVVQRPRLGNFRKKCSKLMLTPGQLKTKRKSNPATRTSYRDLLFAASRSHVAL